jgi:uncharacterized protein YhdP
MNNVSGDVVFDRLNFKVNGASGKWGGVPFTQIKAEIPNLISNTVVNVQGESKSSAKQVLNDLRLSPVNSMLGGIFTQASGTGTVNSRLKLSLPLAALEKTTLQGALILSGNDVRLLNNLPAFEKSQGTITFSESGFSLAGVNAQFLGGPIKLEGGSRKLPAKSPVGQSTHPGPRSSLCQWLKTSARDSFSELASAACQWHHQLHGQPRGQRWTDRVEHSIAIARHGTESALSI